MSNEAKHTKGPWTASQTYPHGDWCIHSAGIPWQLAYVGASTQIDWPLAANAHLIAAAPDMLAALMKAKQFIVNGVELGFIRMPDTSTPDPAHETLPIIEAAIAKAEGRQP